MINPLPDETAASIRNALTAGRKLDAVRLYREATGAGLAEAKAFVDQLESGSPDTNDLAKSEKPAKSLTDFGWIIEPTDAGVRMRHSTLWYGAMTGCSLVILLVFSPFVIVVWFAGKGFWQGPPDDGVWQILWRLTPLLVAGGGGLIVTLIVVQILRFALLREAWEVGRNSLVVRRRLLGISRSREHRDGELVLEPHYDRDRHDPQWRLAIHGDGEKHFLLPEPMAFGYMSAADSRTECLAVANVLATHTGWNVRASEVGVEDQMQPPAASNEEELLATLQSRRFIADVDEQLRLTIRPPKLGQWIAGLVLLAMGLGGLWVMAGAVNSFVNDAQAQQQPIMQIPFWLLMTPMLMVGVGLCALGVAGLFGRERWTVDRNLLLVRSRIFGWSSEHEYVNACWKLAKVRRTDGDGHSYAVWQLQLENQSGRTLKVLHTNRDDDNPRLLGTLLSQRTGWPLQAENPI